MRACASAQARQRRHARRRASFGGRGTPAEEVGFGRCGKIFKRIAKIFSAFAKSDTPICYNGLKEFEKGENGMKKIVGIVTSLLIAAMLFVFCGCARSDLGEALIWLANEYADNIYPVSFCFDINSDGTVLTVDTNPDDRDDYNVYMSFQALQSLNSHLGMDEVWSAMLITSWSDGLQSYTVNGIRVSWTYHPDRGLEATYTYAD